MKPDFTDQNLTVAGSLTTLDASITLAVGVEMAMSFALAAS